MLMKAPNPYQTFQSQDGSTYTADSKGIIANVTNGDVLDLMNMGCVPGSLKSDFLNLGAVVTASLTQLIANVAATNISLTIAAQPDVPRQGVFTFAPGAANVTAGNLAVVYKDQNGQTQTDNFSLITSSGVSLSPKTTKAIASLVSATITGLVGGSSPTVQAGTNTTVGLPSDVGSFGFSVYKETQNGADVATIGAVDAANGLYTLTTAPNSAKLLCVWYNNY